MANIGRMSAIKLNEMTTILQPLVLVAWID